MTVEYEASIASQSSWKAWGEKLKSFGTKGMF